MKILASFEKMRMWSLLLTVWGVTMVSCSDILEEEVVDCSVEYRVKFKYDHNMKFADAFANEVRSVTLYAFDQDGTFVYQRTEQGDILGEDDSTLLSTDTINSAFSKLQVQLNKEKEDRSQAITEENTNWTSEIARLEEIINGLTERIVELETALEENHPKEETPEEEETT